MRVWGMVYNACMGNREMCTWNGVMVNRVNGNVRFNGEMCIWNGVMGNRVNGNVRFNRCTTHFKAGGIKIQSKSDKKLKIYRYIYY